MFKCEICGKEFETKKGFGSHIAQKHKNEITIEEYYLKFIGEKNICPECGKDTKFIGIKGYNKFCGPKCSSSSKETQNKMKKTCFKNSGYENPMQDPTNQEKYKQTNFEKTGYNYPMQDPKNQEKHKQTCLENSGYEYSFQNPVTKEKRKQTNLKKLGVEYSSQNPETRKKAKHTYFEKTGYDYPMQNPETREKSEKSKLRNNNGIHPLKLTYEKLKERYPLLVEIEELIEGPNGEIMGHCKNASCKNSKENGGYFKLTSYQIGLRKDGINRCDTGHFYCSQNCKDSCPLYRKSSAALHNLITENLEKPYTQAEYSTWHEEVLHRQRIENNITYNFCEYCESSENLHVHHEVPVKLEPGYALDPNNGIIVCEKCHYKICHKKGTDCSTGKLANKICK